MCCMERYDVRMIQWMGNVSFKDQLKSDQLRDRLIWTVLEDVCRIGDFVGLATLREWMRVLGLADVEQLRQQVQLVEEGQRKHGKK